MTYPPLPVDYGYGLTFTSLEKYLNDKYSNDNDEYFIVAYTMPMDYEKYYKNGYFIDLDGINTGNDFWILSDANKLAKIAEIENTWIAYVVYKLKK